MGKNLPHCKCLFYFFILLLFSIQSCDYFPFNQDPLKGPFKYEFKYQRNLPGEGYIIDLNHDGVNEYISRHNTTYQFGPSNIQIWDDNLNYVTQVDFYRNITNVFTIDYTNNGIDEIIVTYTCNDSSFIRLLDNTGKKLDEAFLFSGQSWDDGSEIHPWVGQIKEIYYKDLDLDSENEWIIVASEGHARKPRGIFVYDGKTFEIKWEYEIGPSVSHPISIYDYDNDNFPEIFLSTNSPGNGNKANNTTDDSSYIFMFEHTGELKWKRSLAGKNCSISSICSDIDANISNDILIYVTHNKVSDIRPQVMYIDPSTGKSLKASKNFLGYGGDFDELQIVDSKEQEIIIYTNPGKIALWNNNLETILEKKLSVVINCVYTCEDLNNDGYNEIFISTNEGSILLDKNLNILAKTEKLISFRNEIFHRGNEPPWILLIESENNNYFLASFKKKQNYLVNYYGPPLLTILGIFFISLLIGYNVYSRSNLKYSYRLFYTLFMKTYIPVLYLDEMQNIKFINKQAQKLLRIENINIPISKDSNFTKNSEFLRKVSQLIEQEKNSFIKDVQLEKNKKKYSIIAEIVYKRGSKKPEWLIMIEELNTQIEISWTAMAQRISHDIKNPLTSIQLTLQRLQREYHEKDPSNSEKYDEYTHKITERIEALKRMSRNFMKFLNVEKPNLQKTGINQLINNLFAKSIIEIPNDIKLIENYATNLPEIKVDQEQVQTMFENLVTNAINAMSNGGSLSIKTNLVSDLQIEKNDLTPKDYILIEIMDTGIGIAEKIREKLFQPFITSTHLGTGLGLTIVKKIIDDHNGHIEVNSEEGIGTSFLIYLLVA